MSNNNFEALIIEDTDSDRTRMRILLDSTGVSYKFAWTAEKKEVISIDEIIKILKKYSPKILVIDLAWTIEDDKRIATLKFKDFKQIESEKNKFDEQQKSDKNKKTWISGIELIDRLVYEYNKEGDIKEAEYLWEMKKIVIISKYIRPISYGLWEYLYKKLDQLPASQSFVTKWMDEKDFCFIVQ